MEIDLTGRTAVVTGGSKGIGLAVTRALADSGARVIVGAKHSSDEIERLAAVREVTFADVDLADPAGPQRLVEMAAGTVDILVNNVGGARARPGGFLSITDDDWTTSLTLNLLAAVRATRAALPGMLAAGAGSIVMTCSVNARLPDPAVPRLQRRQSRTGKLREGAVQGGWPAPVSGSTQSARGPSPLTCGSVTMALPRPSARPPARSRPTLRARQRPRALLAGSAVPRRSRT